MRLETLLNKVYPFKSFCLFDHMPEHRDFDFIPLWNMRVVFRYRMRRVNCPSCGVKVEQIPRADGKVRIAKPFQLFLAV